MLKNGQAVIFLKESTRPSLDVISTILLDYVQGVVIDFIDLGKVKGKLGILKTKKGYKIRIVKEFLKEMKCDCDVAYIDEWLEIWVDKKRLNKAWFCNKK